MGHREKALRFRRKRRPPKKDATNQRAAANMLQMCETQGTGASLENSVAHEAEPPNTEPDITKKTNRQDEAVPNRIPRNSGSENPPQGCSYGSFPAELWFSGRINDQAETETVELNTERESYSQPHFLQTVQGRRICDAAHVILSSAKVFVTHSRHCNGLLAFVKEKRVGFFSSFVFKCEICSIERIITTEREENVWFAKKEQSKKDGRPVEPDTLRKPDEKQAHSVNVLMTWGTMSVGSGHNHLEEMCSTASIPCMTRRTFTQHADIVGGIWKEEGGVVMLEGLNEEKEAAIAANRIDEDGVPLITVIGDGGWSQRSHGTRYTAKSGVGVLIGHHTGKILYIGVRNKYCSVCFRAARANRAPAKHKCFKNWDGPSTAMEADILVQGVRECERRHSIRFSEYIGDGDSSTYNNILATTPRTQKLPRKLECANHLIKNFKKGLFKLQAKNKFYKKTLTALLICKLCQAARGAIKRCSNEKSTVEQLRAALDNGPKHHLLADHRFCEPSSPGKKGCKFSGQKLRTSVPMELQNLYKEVCLLLNRLKNKGQSLQVEVTTNSAERYMSIVAKLNGGKQILRSQRGSYMFRCYGAVLAFRYGRSFHAHVLRKYGHGSQQLDAFEERHRASIKSWKKRYLKSRDANDSSVQLTTDRLPEAARCGLDTDYGLTDTDPDSLASDCTRIRKQLQLTREEISTLEQTTRGQSESHEWWEARRNRITASMFGRICKMRDTTSRESVLREMILPSSWFTEATQYGKVNEEKAREKYSREKGVTVTSSGLWVHPQFGFLAASPDGLIGEDGLLEIKCPKIAETEPLLSLVRSKRASSIGLQIAQGEKLKLNRRHNYYFQIKGQLAITDRLWCDFVVWRPGPEELFVERIQRDTHFWQTQMLPKLQSFFDVSLLPEIADSRLIRNLPTREPECVLQAIKARKDTTQPSAKRRKKNQSD